MPVPARFKPPHHETTLADITVYIAEVEELGSSTGCVFCMMLKAPGNPLLPKLLCKTISRSPSATEQLLPHF
jgi:hypothetical protein